MLKIEDLLHLLNSGTEKSIAIIPHRKPDGDALGSSLGLFHFLKKLGHQVNVVSPTDYAENLKWLPGNEEVIIYEQSKRKGQNAIKKADLIFCLDFSNIERVEHLGTAVLSTQALKIVIDHHAKPEDFGDLLYWDVKACATTELIYGFIAELELTKLIDKRIATCLYTGLVTDSGSFKYASTRSNSHQVAAALLQHDIEHQKIHEQIDGNVAQNALEFFGFCFQNRLKVLPEHRTAYLYAHFNDLKKFNIRTGQTEGLVNHALNLKGIRFAALIIDRGDLVKISFRSKGNFPANAFAEKYFHGGGHFNAAGGRSEVSLDKTLVAFEEKLAEFYPKVMESN